MTYILILVAFVLGIAVHSFICKAFPDGTLNVVNEGGERYLFVELDKERVMDYKVLHLSVKQVDSQKKQVV